MSSDQLKHINLEAINDIADGDDEFVKEIIVNYLRIIPDSVEGLKKSIDERDAEAIKFFAHKLKGSFSFVGATELQELAANIELNPSEYAKLDNSFSKIHVLSDEVQAELTSIVDSLNL